MQYEQENPAHRAVFALLVAGLIAFAVWGVWMLLSLAIGAVGWLVSTVGNWLLTGSDKMGAIHTNVAWIALACGAVVGTVIGFNIRVDRLWGRVTGKKQTVEEAR